MSRSGKSKRLKSETPPVFRPTTAETDESQGVDRPKSVVKPPENTSPPDESVLQQPPAKGKGKKRKPAATTIFSPNQSVQRLANAEAKQSRIRRAGIQSRLLGHVSASGKRAQGRRDSKNK